MSLTTRSVWSLFLIGSLSLFSCASKKLPFTITQHTDVTHVTGVAVFDDAVFCATKGGLVRWDIEGSMYTIYTTVDGLPSNVLTDVVVDSGGLLWVSSVDGIVTFDGQYFKVVSSDGLPSEEVNDLAVAPDGSIWAGTLKGAAIYSGGRFRPVDGENSPGASNITVIYFDQGGNEWIGTDDNGMFYRTEGVWKHLTTKNGFPINTIVTVVQAWDRSMWGASWAGISRFDGMGWKTFSSMNRFGTYDARCLLSTDKRLWYFTSNGVHASQGGDWFSYTEDNGLISNDVTCGFIVSDEEVYVGTVDGLSIIRNGVVENYFIPNSPVGYNCISIAIDNRDRVWLGTWETGLNIYDSGFWTLVTGNDLSALDTVRSVVYGPDGMVVFNTMSGVVFERQNEWNIQTRNQGLSGNDVRCGLFDAEGRYWAGTAAGVCYYDKGSWHRYRTVHGLPSEDTWACASGSDGTLWFGTSAGIVSFKDAEITDRTSELNLGEVDVRSIVADGDRILFGTEDGKLIEYKDGKWDVYGESFVGTNKGIYSIAFDDTGRIWLGTNGDGIVTAGSGQKIKLTVKDGLPSNYVKAVALRGDNVWAACFGGVVNVDLSPNASAK